MSSGPLSILLVDDEPAHVEAVRSAFQTAAQAVEFRVVRTLRACEEALAAGLPDLILTALVLPDGRATDLLVAAPGVPILVITGRGDEPTAAAVIKGGAIDYVVKSPEAFAELPHTVERALREWGVRQERLRLVDSLRESQATLRALLDGNPSPTALLDANGTILAANLVAARLLGRPVTELVGSCAFDLVSAEVAAARRARMAEAIDSGELVRFEEARAGRHFVYYLQPVPSPGGATPRLASMAVDITDRMLAEQALRASEQQFHDLVVSVDAIVYHVSVDDGNVLRSGLSYISPQIESVLGYRPEEFLRKPQLWTELMHPEDRERVLADTARFAAERGESLIRSYRMRRKGSDECRWLEDRVVAAHDQDGRLVALRGVAHDVTDRRRAEQALREQAALLRESQRVASVGHYSLAIVADVLTTSEGFDDVFGIGPGYPHSFAGWLSVVHPDDRDRLGVHYQEHVLRDKLPFELEYRILRPSDGVERWVHGLGRLELDADGLPARMFGTVQDVTERRVAEDALREQARLLRDSQRAASMGHCQFDIRTGVLTTSEEFEAVYGSSSQRPLDFASALSIVHPDDRDRVVSLFQETVVRHGLPFDMEYRIVRPCDGVERWVRGVANLELDAEGQLQRVFGSVQDITTRKQAETERLELERRLLRAQKLESLGVLAGGVAHDFNNLLTGIIGSLELATLGLPADSPAREDIDNAARAGRRAAELSRKMLSYSGKGRFVIQRLELCEVVRSNERLMKAALAPGTRLDLRLCPEPCTVEADKDQIEQALLALVTNAAEAIGERQGVIRLSTGVLECDQRYLGSSRIDPKPAPGRFAYIEIADTGCGMDAATLDKVFDPFFSTKFAGRGLGLPVLLGIARGHKGAILLDSTPGNGTRVRVLLPSVAAGTSDVQPAIQPAPQVVAARATVLVVDDEDAVREPCLQLIRRLGFDTLAASDGLQGLAVVQKHGDAIACVVLDLTMPGMDGVATLLMMRRLRPGLRIILSSGYGEQDVMERFGVERPNAFLQKPYSGEDLRKTIASVLARTS